VIVKKRDEPTKPPVTKRTPFAARALLLLVVLGLAGCTVVRPWQRERLSSPAMQFQMAPFAEVQQESVVDITEGGSFPSAGPGSAGAGCGCH